MFSRDISHNYPIHYANDDHFSYASGAKAWSSLGSSVTIRWLFRLNTTLYRSLAFQLTMHGCKAIKQNYKKLWHIKKGCTISQKKKVKSSTRNPRHYLECSQRSFHHHSIPHTSKYNGHIHFSLEVEPWQMLVSLQTAPNWAACLHCTEHHHTQPSLLWPI